MIFIIYIVNINYRNINSNIKGFWSASEKFCNDAKINLIWLFINNNNTGWIIIKKSNKEVLNQITNVNIKINMSDNIKLERKSGDKISGCIYFYDVDSDQFPVEQKFKLYPNIGRLILYNNDDIYADLYKNSKLTDLSLDIDKTSNDINDIINISELISDSQ